MYNKNTENGISILEIIPQETVNGMLKTKLTLNKYGLVKTQMYTNHHKDYTDNYK